VLSKSSPKGENDRESRFATGVVVVAPGGGADWHAMVRATKPVARSNTMLCLAREETCRITLDAVVDVSLATNRVAIIVAAAAAGSMVPWKLAAVL